MHSDREPRTLTKSAMRRRWKLQVMKSLSSEIGISISDIRRMLGKTIFDKVLDETYRASATDPETGTKLVREKLLSEYGVELGQEPRTTSGSSRQ
jgi:hypothetical protein